MASACAWGAQGRGFKSHRPDHKWPTRFKEGGIKTITNLFQTKKTYLTIFCKNMVVKIKGNKNQNQILSRSLKPSKLNISLCASRKYN